ncbi:MAG: hypoxanthine phosphoribosyltransferase [Chloroflexi bacterium]|nr:hypoxanthine phosphoribosyltransferase [Chloroflexota bacterium]
MKTERTPDSLSNMSLHLSREEIREAVRRLGGEISRDYAGKRPLLLGVLRGAFIFLADLVREIDIPLTVDFIRAQSYKGATSTGEVVLSLGDVVDVRGRDVLVVEDIVDTGTTISCLLDYLSKGEPASVKLCSLLDKPSRRVTAVDIDYLGFIVPDRFVVGYGTDLDQDWRNLPEIFVMEDGSGVDGG